MSPFILFDFIVVNSAIKVRDRLISLQLVRQALWFISLHVSIMDGNLGYVSLINFK